MILYVSDWAISATLTQKHDGVYTPVRFSSRTLKPNELNYHAVEKEILALLQILNECFNMVAGRRVRVLSRYTTMAWLFRSKGLQGRLAQWAAILSPWTLEIEKCTKGEEEIFGLLAASITPRGDRDRALADIAPRQTIIKDMLIPVPRIMEGEIVHVVTFDGSAKSKRSEGAFSAAVWELPGWTVRRAASVYNVDLTVNEAEYRGLLLGLELLQDLTVERVIIAGDSNLAIRQLRGEMECKAPGLQLLREKARKRLERWNRHEFVHVKRDWNQSADMLTGQALQRKAGIVVEDDGVREDLQALNRLGEILRVQDAQVLPKVSAVTRGAARRSRLRPQAMDELSVIHIRLDRIRQVQDEEQWIATLKYYLQGDLGQLSSADASDSSKIADKFEIDDQGLLLYMPRSESRADEEDDGPRLVVPTTLHGDLLHHYHTSLEGGHQGIGRTYYRLRRWFYWRSMYRDVQRYVGECVDCVTGKGRPTIRGESPGNVLPAYPFQVIAMDHIPTSPKSLKGNTELLVFVDLFSGFVVAKASASREAQTVAETYEECVFRRFGASEAIRHDREPGFMADFFRAFNRLIKQRQRATMAYRPQANGTAERMMQTLTRSIKMYVGDAEQRDWDEYAERLVFALNTSFDRARQSTPFYIVHGWHPRSMLEATLALGNNDQRDLQPTRWRFKMQRHYADARARISRLIQQAQESRAAGHNAEIADVEIIEGSSVWLYIDRVKPGYARKLAHMWHGPFVVAEKISEYAVKLENRGTDYRFFPTVHISKLKPLKQFPERPTAEPTVEEGDRFDFDEALLSEDS